MASDSWEIIHAITPLLTDEQEQHIRLSAPHVMKDPGSVPLPTGNPATSSHSRVPFNFGPGELTVEALSASRDFVLEVTGTVRFETDSDDPHVQVVVDHVNAGLSPPQAI